MYEKRLDKLFSLIPVCRVLADVGCDHGYIGIEALQTGRAEKVYFTDISEPSLNKARANCPPELLDRAEFVCGDGLCGLKADVAVIAGMGGRKIISIISASIYPPQFLVLQPNSEASAVREFISRNYRFVTDEKMLDGKFYDHIAAKFVGTGVALNELESEFGTTNLSRPNADFRLYLAKERDKLTKILSGCRSASAERKLSLVMQAIAAVGGVQ